MPRILSVLLIAISLGCSGGCGLPLHPAGPAGTSPVRVMVESAVRIVIDCDGDGRPEGYGSATVVGPRHLLTARHVAAGCEDSPTPDLARFTAIRWDGAVVEVMPDAYPADPEVDAARLVVVGAHEFTTWAGISFETPQAGDRVYNRAGDGDLKILHFKEGFVGSVFSDQIVLDLHGVPGNSGSGIFNARGELIGILWGGKWNPAQEFTTLAYRPGKWADLLDFPPPSPDVNVPLWP